MALTTNPPGGERISEQAGLNLRAATSQVFNDAAVQARPMQVAEMSFKAGWVSDVASRQVYNPSTAVTVGGQTVVTGAAGYNNNGAFGLRPILKPGS